MATCTLLANTGNDRLVMSTIRTHLIFFHEAGYQYVTERKRRHPVVLWNPLTWRGFAWVRSQEAEQPRDVHCTFNKDGQPSVYGATVQSTVGLVRMSCEYLSIRRHCVWMVAGGEPAQAVATPPAGDGARTVRDVSVRFGYAGRDYTLHH